MSFLGVTPGAVTILGLVNDVDSKVELVFDAEIWQSAAFLCHPLVNTATLVLSRGLVAVLPISSSSGQSGGNGRTALKRVLE